MKQNLSFTAVCLAIAVASLPAVVRADAHSEKAIQVIQIDTRPCVFFVLNGVSLADASLPSAGAWFSLPRTHPNFTEINAALLSAKLAGKPISVFTSGAAECDFAGVARVDITQ